MPRISAMGCRSVNSALLTCLDATLRRLGGARAFALTDNETTVTGEHVPGIRCGIR